MSLRFILVALILMVLPIDVANAVAPGGFVPCDGVDCSLCNLVDMINEIIIWLFGIIFITFGIIALIAGFGLVTSRGNQVALDAAKTKLSNAIIGLIIVMAAWLLIDTIMRGLMDGGTGEIRGWGPWTDVQCQVQTEAVQAVREGAGAVDGVQGQIPPPTGPVAPGGISQAEAEAQLNNNIDVSSSGGCSDRNNSSCTSLDGIQPTTIQRINELQSAIGQPITITGGTETGHAGGQYSHANGYKVDVRTDPAVNNYITQNFTPLGGNKWQDPNGNIYYRHGPVDHWDITITN